MNQEIKNWLLFNQALSGDERAWKLLVVDFRDRLYELIFSICRSRDIAKDIVQESFIRLQKRGVPEKKGSFSAYLTTIAFRLALKEKSRNKSESCDTTLDSEMPAQEFNPLQKVMRAEQVIALGRAILELEEHHRQVIVLRFQLDHSYLEIAEILDLPLGTVKSRIFTATKMLLKIMNREGH